ncbi:MAG: DNA/RNA nuclease SfsA [Ruminococcaceae bacterium]|nr:DNA/RNA nuclease SfsA [Oscillospiraceae bacterium]
MKYSNIKNGIFLSRPNRFIAHVMIDGREEVVHVKNTGRCKELLLSGSEVFCVRSDNTSRKTAYDLVAVKKGSRLINMDSQAPNAAFLEWVNEGKFIGKPDFIKPEYKWRNSRFDFFVRKDGRKILAEIKGVTLELDGACFFPDAPTERGIKHINELIAAAQEGYETYIVFIIQMKDVSFFSPNENTHPQFCEALRRAGERGVNIIAYDCLITEDSMVIRDKVPVIL